MKNLLQSSILFILLLTVVISNAQEKVKALVLEAGYVSEVVGNMHGGLKTGSNYLGMIDLMATFDTEKAGLWNNGTFYVQLESTHGGTPSAENIGDVQVTSNIENGHYTYLYQLWYGQVINKFSFLVGLHDLNSEFVTSEYMGEYLNSSFGIMPSVSLNIPVAIFPKTTLCAVMRYQFNENYNLLFGLYNGDPRDLDTDPYFNKMVLGKESGLLSILEFSAATFKKEGYNGNFKIGGYYHSADIPANNDTLNTLKGNYGIYAIYDQMIVPFGDDNLRGLAMFAALGLAPKDRNFANYSWALGLNLMAPFKNRFDDIIGLGVHSVNLNFVQDDMSINTGIETALECFYKLKINDKIQVQPELQYIINPGAESNFSNATVGLIRAYINF